jgi:carbamoyl-phosphate synthase large subunit
VNNLSKDNVYKMKELGYSDRQLGFLIDSELLTRLYDKGEESQKEYSRTLKDRETKIREFRNTNDLKPGYRLVDTCGGEFEAYTPYYYSAYDDENEARKTDKKKVMILGGGPNRIGQGIEFDYCCCHASYALKEEGIESIMVNSNPETVSTDYDTSDKLYFEPLTLEDILHIYESEKPEGVIVQFGGQTPLRLADQLQSNGVKILGTSPESIDRAEDREKFADVVNTLNLNQPENGIAFNKADAIKVANEIGYPVLVRPSYVLGGRAMAIIYDEESLLEYIKTAVNLSPEHPILVDQFLEDALEVDVDAICDGEDIYIGAIMQHIEQAGVHSGDSACMIPPKTIKPHMMEEIKTQTKALALELEVKGLLNIQFALKNDVLYVIEVNPRASRTVPFVSKAKGVPLAKIALKVMIGAKLKEFNLGETTEIPYKCIKEAVLPFNKFPGCDTLLSPEMKSTGEVMGIARDFGEAFYKASLAAGDRLPSEGNIFVSINDKSKEELFPELEMLVQKGFNLVATEGTAQYLNNKGVKCEIVHKVNEGRPNILDMVKNEEIQLILNTPKGKIPKHDSNSIRQVAVKYHIPIVTTGSAIKAAVEGIIRMKENNDVTVCSIQEYHNEVNGNA